MPCLQPGPRSRISLHMACLPGLNIHMIITSQVEEWEELREQGLWYGKY